MILFHDAPGRLRPGRRIYAIGDIHGSLGKLRDLHGMIARDMRARPGADALLIHLGDYVDKAGDARALTTAMFAVFEEWIRATPEQWMWWNTRWVKDDGTTFGKLDRT